MYHSGTAVLFLTLHSLLGLQGDSHPPAAVVNLPGLELCHTLPPPPHRERSPASRHRSGITGTCERLPGPQRMWSSKWQHVECVCFDVCGVYKKLVSGTVSVCLWVIDSPFVCCFLSFRKIQNTPILPIFHQIWTVYTTTCYDVSLRKYKDMISSSPEGRHEAQCALRFSIRVFLTCLRWSRSAP